MNLSGAFWVSARNAMFKRRFQLTRSFENGAQRVDLRFKKFAVCETTPYAIKVIQVGELLEPQDPVYQQYFSRWGRSP
jgi:hypothetical protein